MKVILSRKGFDSAAGGHPSLVINNSILQTIPIPSKGDHNIYSTVLSRYEGKSLFDLIHPIYDKIGVDKFHQWDITTECHLDPDIDYRAKSQRPVGWKGCFGQAGIAEKVLENCKVEKDDIFLFFGWFQHCDIDGNSINLHKGNGKHILFGYLQVGEIYELTKDTKDEIPEWLKEHPHADKERIDGKLNRIYVARDTCSWDNNIKGYGVFPYKEELVLTKEGLTRSRWKLQDGLGPDDVNIEYHSKKAWKEDYFQSAGRGQEFVIDENLKVNNMVRDLISRLGSKIE